MSSALKRFIKRIPGVRWVARGIHRALFGSASLPVTEETRRRLRSAVDYVYFADVAGNLAEFGTMSGRTAAEIAAAMVERERSGTGPGKRLHLFDSFQGLPECASPVDRESPHVAAGVWAAGTCKVLNPAELLAHVASKSGISGDRLQVHEGWYRDTVPLLPADALLGLIHVDCDLYQSTLDALDPLFARGQVAEGAAILFDDWNCNRGSPAYGERRAWSELEEKYSVRSSDEGGYSWHGHMFIVHSYAPKKQG